MPTYEYYCTHCDKIYELFHSMSAPDAKECPSCHQASLKKQISLNAGIIFKGGGFYETDYKRTTAPAGDKPAEAKKPDSSNGNTSQSSANTSSTTTTEAKTTTPKSE